MISSNPNFYTQKNLYHAFMGLSQTQWLGKLPEALLEDSGEARGLLYKHLCH